DSATYSVTVTDGNNCIAYDEVIIMSYNIGIQSIVAPESQCELSNAENLSVEIINSGNSSIFDGDSIIFNYELNGIPISEKLILSNDLLPSEMLEYEFIQNMDMSSYGNYDLVVFISKDYDNDRANDSTLKNIVVFGNPLIDIGPGVIYTGRADTISLDAGSGYEQYLWQDGSTLSTYQINNLDSALYSVTVTNEYNCSTHDELTIMSYNIGIQSVNVPESDCELSNAEEASLEIVNKGNTGIYAGDSLIFNYIINEEPVQEKIILDKDFLPDETLEYSFVRKMDMSIHGEYNLEIYLSKDFDNNLQDDTVKNIIEVYGYPVIDLGEDTIYTAKADTIEFILNDQYDTYLWQDGSTNSYYSVTDLASSKYSVTVTNDKNCITEDEIIVMSYDLDLQSVNFPESDCELSESEEISLVILNASNTSILPGDYVIVDYHIKELHNSKKIVFTDTLKPSENYNYTINEKIDMSGIGIYNMIVSIEKEYDYNDKNNSMSEKVEVYGYPEVSLGGDTEDKLYVTLPYRLTPDGDFITYLWHDGTTDEEYKIRYEGWVKVTVTDENNCPGSDSVYIMINTDDINELSKDICAYQVFPNPVNKNLYIKFPAQADSEFIIEIIDITGNVTYTNKYVLNRNENNLINIGVSEFPSGLYILRIISLNSQKVYKVILQ
ncbi:MAG: T9SS type A sorting domain-containing protein, partial [Bacteroidales bacterium]|nr:T9SS type A sorting domain-containing protein [Bacteroidales bacterium]